MSLLELKRGLTLPELLDYSESLDAMQMLEEAARKDADRQQKAQSQGQGK